MKEVQNKEVLVKMPDSQNIKRLNNLYKNRTKPPKPQTLLDFNVNHPYTVTKWNQQFLLYNSGRYALERLLIFSTEGNMYYTLLSDGTIKSFTRQFMILFTSHGINVGHVLPMVYILSTNKSQVTYPLQRNEERLYTKQFCTLATVHSLWLLNSQYQFSPKFLPSNCMAACYIFTSISGERL